MVSRPGGRIAAATTQNWRPQRNKATSNSTKRGRLGAAVALAAFGVILVGAGCGRIGRSSAEFTGNLRFSRKLTAASAADARKLAADKVPPSLVETVHRLADPFLADESSIFAFDDTDPRPVINTFFAIRDGQTISRADAEMLAVWRRAWDGFGWNPRILNIHHAEAHPEYAAIAAKLNNDVPLGADPVYDRSCYLRHFAMAVNGGGWMTDYDTIPLNMNADVYGKELPNEGQFTSYEVHVPSLIVGNSDEWMRVSRALLREGVNAGTNEDVGFAKEGQPRLFSDMYALGALVEKGEVIVHAPHSVFQAHESSRTMAVEIMGWDLDVMTDYLGNPMLQKHCEETRYIMALHFSHSSVTTFGYGPDNRPILIAAFLDRWSKLCGGPDFHFWDDAGTLYKTDGTMAISRANKLVYVHLPKTGGSSVEHSALFDDSRSHHAVGGHHTIGVMTKNAQERGISNFVKAAHIRHPCSRFVSAYAYLTSEICNLHDKRWAKENIGNMSLDEFLKKIEQEPTLLEWVHFTPMWHYVFTPEGKFGLDVALCQENWNEGLDVLGEYLGGSDRIPKELYSSHSLQNAHSSCAELRPETRQAMERVYAMDYCIFGFSSQPQTGCQQTKETPEVFTERYARCVARFGPHEPRDANNTLRSS